MQYITITCGIWNALCEVFTIEKDIAHWWIDKPEVQLNYHSYGLETEIEIPDPYRLTLPDQSDLLHSFGPMWDELNTITVYDDKGELIDEFKLEELSKEQVTMEMNNLDYSQPMLFRKEEGKGGVETRIVLQDDYNREDFHFVAKQFDGDFGVISEVHYEHDENTYRWQISSMRSVGSWVRINQI